MLYVREIEQRFRVICICLISVKKRIHYSESLRTSRTTLVHQPVFAGRSKDIRVKKKELQEIAKRKLKAEGELKVLKSDLSIKTTLSKNVSQSFEARIHDVLIRTNPNKYLTESNRPKEGVVLADTYILKKYYGGRVPDVETLETMETESEIFQTIINSHKAEKTMTRHKNSVIKEMETRGIKRPNTSGQDACPGYPAS